MKKISGKPCIGRIIDRLQECKAVDDIIIACGAEPQDGDIIEYVVKRGCKAIRGSTEDVLGRFLAASRYAKQDKITRITADLPLISYEGIEDMDSALTKDFDYVNNLDSAMPYLEGTGTEVMWKDTLERMNRYCEGHWREHVSVYARYWAHGFRIRTTEGPDISDIAYLTLMLDEPHDLTAIELVQNEMDAAGTMDYLTLLEVVRANKKKLEKLLCE